jgi:hypothetical protein
MVNNEKRLNQNNGGNGRCCPRGKERGANGQCSNCGTVAFHANLHRDLQARHLCWDWQWRNPQAVRIQYRRDRFLRDLQPEPRRVAVVGQPRHFFPDAREYFLCQRLALYGVSRRSSRHPVCLKQSLFCPDHDPDREDRADGFDRRRQNATQIWNANGSVSGDPPVNGAFYGDFGMGLAYNSNGVTNLVAQLHYGRGVTAGFRIHANPLTQKAFVQIGLTRRDIANHSALYLPMNVDDDAPDRARTSGTGFNYFSQQIFDATVHITDHKNNRSLKSPGVGMITDTGATTTLHNTQESPEPLPAKYEAFITWDNPAKDAGKLNDGLTFELSARTTSGRKARFFKFKTTSVVDAGNVNVQNNSSNYFMNTGISLFYFYDMIYTWRTGRLAC